MKRYLTLAVLCTVSSACFAAPRHRAAPVDDNAPRECVSAPVNTAPVMLQNAGFLNSQQDIDESKTEATRLAAQKIGKDLYAQVYDITFYKKSGGAIHVITHNTLSKEECSAGHIEVYVVSKKILDNDPPVIQAPTK